MNIVAVDNLVKRYNEVLALDHFSLHIESGEVFGLLGPNGSGKTTAINCILQLLTYATSYNMLPAVRDLDVPVVLVNVQKKKAPDYANTDTPTWLGELYALSLIHI